MLSQWLQQQAKTLFRKEIFMAKKIYDVRCDIDMFKTGMNISNFRIEKGYSQADIAEMLHVSSKTVSNWERGIKLISLKHLAVLSYVLDTTTNDLLSLSAEKVVTLYICYFLQYLTHVQSLLNKSI